MKQAFELLGMMAFGYILAVVLYYMMEMSQPYLEVFR